MLSDLVVGFPWSQALHVIIILSGMGVAVSAVKRFVLQFSQFLQWGVVHPELPSVDNLILSSGVCLRLVGS